MPYKNNNMTRKKKNNKKQKNTDNSDGYISILTPTYNRPHLLPLITYNIKNQLYDHSKLEWFIYDDGPNPFFSDETLKSTRDHLYPIKIKYFYDKKKQSIGYKRNYLVKNATHKVIAMMDDDDIYFPTYISTYYKLLKEKKVGLVGSPEMLFVYPKLNYLISFIKCIAERQIHEATMLFTKKYYNSMPGFNDSSRGEGAKIIDFNENNVHMTSVSDCMICISHNDNTIAKDKFQKNKTTLKLKDENYIKLIEDIFGDLVNVNPNPEDFYQEEEKEKELLEESIDDILEESIDDILEDI